MFKPIPQPGILEIAPYVPGESKSSGVNRSIKLAANENPFGCSPAVTNAYISLASELHRYPDGASSELRSALAAHHNIDATRIVCGTGSDEIIALLCKAFAGQGDEILYSQHGFLMYPIAALACGATPVQAPEAKRETDLDALLKCVTDKTKIVFLANPNNPTGFMLKRNEVLAFRKQLRENILLVIDSAYAEYVTDQDYSDGLDLVSQFDNVIMLRTFSKVYGISSLRVGWSYSSAYIADILNRIRGVFNINTPGQVCALAALNDHDFVKKSVTHNAIERARAVSELSALGFTVYPSQGNFVLFSLNSKFGENASDKATDLLSYLKSQGILLRGVKSYDLADCIRMTLGLSDDMTIVFEQLKKFLGA